MNDLSNASPTGSPGVSLAIVLSATADVPFDLTVTAYDPYNNVATSYAGTVHFTSSDPSAQLPADYSFTPTDNGVHIFKVTLKTKGRQKVIMTDNLNGTLTAEWVVTVL